MVDGPKDESTAAWERRHWARIEEVFAAAETVPQDQRERYLDSACGDDPRLRARVEALLTAELDAADEVGALVAAVSPLASARTTAPNDPARTDEPVPDRIGPYQVLREVGRGGSSSVFLAVRADGAFRKQVALKLVRRGLDTQDILRRLHQERQILAGLDHPNIARLLDGGSLQDGRPYLVMDYAEGLPVDAYCRRHGLGVRERITLFVDICRAVHFAHQNLTIHRDIKPSNILVTADGTPKLLDFGIAKVLEPTEELSLQVTGPGVLYMTPAYASPEQLRGDILSTSTDIYSLGVLLHRLLTGVAPYEPGRGSLEALQTAIEAPRPLPSRRVSADSMATLGLPPSQARRHGASIAGDLDTIVTMALRLEPERRYSSAEQMADDMHNYLHGLPVRAQPDRWSYRTKKFVRRHARVLAAGIFTAVMLVGVVSFFSYHLIQERDRAFQASKRAERESTKAAQVTDFLQQVFAISNPSRSQGESVTAVQLLDRGAEQIDSKLTTEPEVRAGMMAVIGQSYAGLGLYDEAGPQLERAFELRRALFRPPHIELALSHQQLGNLRIEQGRFEEAEHHFSESLDQFRRLFGPDDPRTAEAIGDLGAITHLHRRFPEAESLYREAQARLRIKPGPKAKVTLQLESNLVTLLYDRRRLKDAARLGRSVHQRQRATLGERHPDTLATEATLAAILVADSRYKEAEPLLRDLWQRQRHIFGPDHPDVALAANNLAAALYFLRRYDEAEPLYRHALEIQGETHGPGHFKSVSTMLNLADCLAAQRHDDEARTLYEQALLHRRQRLPEMSVKLAHPLISLGELELRAGRRGRAARHLREAVEILSTDRDAASPQRPSDRLEKAERLLDQATERRRQIAGDARDGSLILEGDESTGDAADAFKNEL